MNIEDLYNTFLLRDILRYSVPGAIILGALWVLNLGFPEVNLDDLSRVIMPFPADSIGLFSPAWTVLFILTSWFLGQILDRVLFALRDNIEQQWDRLARARLPTGLLHVYRKFSQHTPNDEEAEIRKEFKLLRQWMAGVVHRHSPRLSKELELKDTMERFYFNVGIALFIWITVLHSILRPLLVLSVVGAYMVVQALWWSRRFKLWAMGLIQFGFWAFLLCLCSRIFCIPEAGIQSSAVLIGVAIAPPLIHFLTLASFWQRFNRDVHLYAQVMQILSETEANKAAKMEKLRNWLRLPWPLRLMIRPPEI